MAFWDGISFTKSQKKGFWLAIWLIGTLCLVIWLSRHFPQSPPDLSYLPQLEGQEADSLSRKSKTKAPLIRLEINTAEKEAWARLYGIGPVLSQRIVRFREAKGGFRSVGEVKQVYGLSEETWESISPFLFLDPATIPQASKPVASPPITPIDINLADSNEWRQLPGIGEVLGRRIIKYRELTGGFSNKEDLRNVYGLSEETYQQIEPLLLLDTTQLTALVQETSQEKQEPELEVPSPATARRVIQKVELNQADSSQLVALPGIGSKLAPRIIRFRERLGFFVEVDQLKSVYGLSEENFQRLQPYLTVSPPTHTPKKDLNTTSSRSLTYLSGIDKAWAEAFLGYRKKLGRFTRWEEVEAFPQSTEQTNRMLRTYFTLTNP